MKKVYVAICVSTLYLIVFQLSPYMGIPLWIIITMFLMAPLVVISLVLITLKYGEPSKFKFEDRFYDDWDYKRNVVKGEEGL